MREYHIPPDWKELTNNPELARIAGDITGDGHLQLDNRRGLVSFYSKNLEDIKKEDRKFIKLFNTKGHVYIDTRKNTRYKIFFSSKKLAAFLASIEIPVGNKTNENFLVPSWILGGNEDIRCSYLRGIFTAEACISITKRRWRIHIEQYKSTKLKEAGINFMVQLQQMLKGFGVITSPVRLGKGNLRKDGTKSIRIQFDIEKRYFDKFYKYIGFDNELKNQKLKIAMRG